MAGCNGGFFSGETYESMGLLIDNGQVSGRDGYRSPIVEATVLSDGETISIIETSYFSVDQVSPETNALQSGPFLVQDGQVNQALTNEQYPPNRRTFLASDGEGRWLIGFCPEVGLETLAEALIRSDFIPGFTARSAINLDGGPSSKIWIKEGSVSEVLIEGRTKVANFLGVMAKKFWKPLQLFRAV